MLLVISAAVAAPAQTGSDLLREPATRATRERSDNLSEVVPIYFPPPPPPLGAAVDRRQPLLDLKWRAPTALGPFVNEPFYPRLATHLIADSMPLNVQPRFHAYLSSRARLRTELAETLAGLREADPAGRLAALEAFARQQTPELADLEWTAERLRRDLGTPHVQWNEDHRRSLRRRTRPPDEKGRRWEYEIVITSAFFKEGLSPGQRRLLREAAIDLEGVPESRTQRAASAGDDPVFFSPETSRVHFPADLPPDLAARLSEYSREKDALKRELRNVAYELDEVRSDSQATDQLRTLARQHEPRLIALDELAEEIRRGVATLGRPDEMVIPPPIAARWEALHADRADLEAEVAGRVEALSQTLLAFQGPFDTRRLLDGRMVSSVNVRDVPDRREFYALTGHSPSPWLKAVYKLIKTELDAAEAAVAGRAAAHRTQEAQIIGELADALGTTPEIATAALQRHERAWRRRTLQEEYAVAVFEPGLSPEQRRLLLDVAMEKLSPPLPGGSLIPYPVVR